VVATGGRWTDNQRVDIDEKQQQRARDRLTTLGGLSAESADALVDAVVAGAVDHAFELINGSGPVPTSMTTAKADQLRWICERLGRLVSQREVEITFRITPASARSILNTMLATYEEGLREQFLDRMRADATVIASGTADTELTWTLRFTESATFDAAWSELSRLGLLSVAEASTSQRRVTVPRVATLDGKEISLLPALGIEEPQA
jgi:hypothetical protein